MITSVQPYESAFTVICEISKVLAASYQLEVALAKTLELLRSFVHMDGIISLFNGDRVLDVVVGTEWDKSSDESYRRRLPRKAIDQIMMTDRPLIVENVAHHVAFSAADMKILGASDTVAVSFIGVPIRVDGNIVGTLTIDRVLDNGSRSPPDRDEKLLTMVATLVGQTIKLHHLSPGDRATPMAEGERLQKQPARARKKVHIKGIIGDSPALNALLKQIPVVAETKTTVMIRGESGTGKELVAKAIHDLSPRAGRPYVKLNCAALTETVLESELFGHEKGAFTSAFNSRKGRFEVADKGTLFLDEIGEISASFQAKLLRVLQEQEFERVGSNQTVKVDVRVIAATNKNLEEAVARNEFRRDLYYRINVVPLHVPPLRERHGDIPLLAAEFLKNFNDENGRTLTFDPSAIDALNKCEFPGNIRELQNCVRRAAILAVGPSIVGEDIGCSNGQCLAAAFCMASLKTGPLVAVPEKSRTPPVDGTGSAAFGVPPSIGLPLAPSGTARLNGPRVTDADQVIAAMEKCGWVQAKAARLLGLTPRQIGYVLRKYGIEIKRL
ncbi:nif-specific transcriptional activator NifA [Mesorhizobium carmichaelinearum]|uniref:nif-specific transcriptional activator NifA n=1 Tax=Mesorhizobium carmichaelinearum TaxID=1208188 RepID=UPI000BA3163E|nr:nif-specific transcriptional activator NifA [Mesorhizobium carmichaelinearum]